MGDSAISLMEFTKISLNQPDSGVSLGLIDVRISLIPGIDPSGLMRANEGSHEGSHEGAD